MLNRHRDQRGFTLIELMVGLVILGIVLSQAMPTFSTWLGNMRIRNSAEAILDGLQLARAQAIRTNSNTELVLTDDAPVKGNVGSVASANGKNWIIRNQQPINGVAFGDDDFVQGRSGQEGSRNALVAASSGSGNTPGGPWNAGSFVFTSLGRLLNPPQTVPPDILVRVDSAPFSGKRRMCIIVSPGGQVLMCDPNKVDPANPQFCPAGACP